MLGDEGPLGNGESAGNTRALLIVFESESSMYVLLVGAVTRHGSQDNSVLQVGDPNADGLE